MDHDSLPVTHISVEDIVSFFEDLEDPRSTINRRHPLVSVVVISLMAVLGGANGPSGIAEWANLKKDFLMELLPLPNGIPQKDVYRRVLAVLDARAFQAAFTEWIAALQARVAAEAGIERPLYHVDGKTLRRSHDRAKGLGALHSVSVWASKAE